MVSKVALTVSPKKVKDNRPSSSLVVSANLIARFLDTLRPVAEFASLGDVNVVLDVDKTFLLITSPDYEVDLLEDFLEKLRPIVEYQNIGEVHVEILEEFDKEETNKLYIVVIVFMGLVKEAIPFRSKELAIAHFGEETSVSWEEYEQRDKSPATMNMLGNYTGSRIYEFDDFV